MIGSKTGASLTGVKIIVASCVVVSPGVDEPKTETLMLSMPCQTLSFEWLNVSLRYLPTAEFPSGMVNVKESVVQVVSVRKVITSLVPKVYSGVLLPSATACAETVNVPGVALAKGSPWANCTV